MPVEVNFNFDPKTRKAVARKLILTDSDGDTPNIQQPIRAVSIDTPEKAGFAGNAPTAQAKLNRCRQRLENGFFADIPQELRNYLANKITDDAAARHINAALRATEEFNRLMDRRLTLPGGGKRKLGIIPTGELIDTYGRLLAYFAPWYAGTQQDPVPAFGSAERETFNLNMIANGWAAFFPIYPSLPKDADFNIAINAAEQAWNNQLGQWAEFGENLLLGYEYRLCIKLSENNGSTAQQLIETAFRRICVDLRDKTIRGRFGFADVPPPYRLWIWLEDRQMATQVLGLIN